ncbi:MAG: regulatory protein RecX [Actinobacteria bacterium]|nr:regulatory protein RecX [Actinomycetota bacterium]
MSSESAREAALRALRHRDLSARELGKRLGARGFEGSEIEETIATLERTGLLDDGRFAASRARTLANRGSGDMFITYDLRRAGLPSDLVEGVVQALEPEPERARSIVARRGESPKTARYLRAKGFSDETVRAVVAARAANELG